MFTYVDGELLDLNSGFRYEWGGSAVFIFHPQCAEAITYYDGYEALEFWKQLMEIVTGKVAAKMHETYIQKEEFIKNLNPH